jgi:hypothetical protein
MGESFRDAPKTRRPRRDSLPYQGPILLAEVEERLERVGEELEDMGMHHKPRCEQAASDKADWEAHLHRVILEVADRGDKTAADIREAYARAAMQINDDGEITGLTGNDLYRNYKINTASVEAEARAMRALEARGGWLQTLSANIRGAT